MIANEMNRAKNWIRKREATETNLAYERAFELIDLKKELLRFRELISELYCQTEKDELLNSQCLNGLVFLTPESYNLINAKP